MHPADCGLRQGMQHQQECLSGTRSILRTAPRAPSHGRPWKSMGKPSAIFRQLYSCRVFFLRISTKHGVDYRDWVGMQPGNMGKQWDSNGFKPPRRRLFHDWTKKPGYSNPIFSCWTYTKIMKIMVDFSQWVELDLTIVRLAPLLEWDSRQLILLFQNPATTNYDHIITFQAIF